MSNSQKAPDEGRKRYGHIEPDMSVLKANAVPTREELIERAKNNSAYQASIKNKQAVSETSAGLFEMTAYFILLGIAAAFLWGHYYEELRLGPKLYLMAAYGAVGGMITAMALSILAKLMDWAGPLYKLFVRLLLTAVLIWLAYLVSTGTAVST